MKKPRGANRRTVLKTMGAGVVGVTTVTGSASADGGNGDKGAYGNGNGLGKFLNEEAVFKESPLWDGEMTDKRGESVVDVAVGAMTSVNVPDSEVPPQLPLAFDPLVVKVSPGATVRWTWVSNPLDEPIPHDVTSLVDDDGDPVLEEHGDVRFHHHAQYIPATEENEEDENPTFEFEFSERGNHLYYCTPHGAPYTVFEPGLGEEVFNAFGMRGAVKVAGKALTD